MLSTAANNKNFISDFHFKINIVLQTFRLWVFFDLLQNINSDSWPMSIDFGQLTIIWYSVNTKYQMVVISFTNPEPKYRNFKILLSIAIPNTELPNIEYQILRFGSVIWFLVFYAQPQVRQHFLGVRATQLTTTLNILGHCTSL